MHKTIKISTLLINLTSIVSLSGCTTPGKNTLPHGGMTMAQIYRMQTGLTVPSDTQSSWVDSTSSNQFDASSYQENQIPLYRLMIRIQRSRKIK